MKNKNSRYLSNQQKKKRDFFFNSLCICTSNYIKRDNWANSQNFLRIV